MASYILSKKRGNNPRPIQYKNVMHGILLVLLGMAWGLQFTLLKVTSNAGINESNILYSAIFLLAVGYLIALICCKAMFRPSLNHIRYFVLSSLFGFIVPLTATVFALSYISAGEIVLIESLSPVFTIAISMLLGTERVCRKRIIAVILAIIGVAILFESAKVSHSNLQLTGLTIALAVPLFWAIDYIYVANTWPTDLSTLQVVTGEAATAALLLIPFIPLSVDSYPELSWGSGQIAIVAFVILSFFEGYLYFFLLKRAKAVFVSLASFVGLISGILWSILILAESHSMLTWIALILISGAMLIALIGKGHQ
ncbi:MAG: DMT family transporter [Methylococcaceae bacterium]|nr:DMT family transporter [Methylococcaceae bacterium]